MKINAKNSLNNHVVTLAAFRISGYIKDWGNHFMNAECIGSVETSKLPNSISGASISMHTLSS